MLDSPTVVVVNNEERTTSCPFACFGSSDDDDSGGSTDDDDDITTLSSSVEAQTTTHTTAHDDDDDDVLAKSRQLCNTSNTNRPVSLGPIIDNSRFVIFDTSTTVSSSSCFSSSSSSTPGGDKGLGLRATKAYKIGQEILREGAVMRIPTTQSASCHALALTYHNNAIVRAYNLLHVDTRCAFMELSSSCEDNNNNNNNADDDDIVLVKTTTTKTPRGIYDTNSFRLGPHESHGGVFLTIARMNHSCRPNVNHYWRPDLQMTIVYACRDIHAGDELCTIYGPSEWMDTASRRQFLNDRFHFICNCEMCLEGNNGGGDERMEQIRVLQEDIALSSSLITTTTTTTTTTTKMASSLSKLEDVNKCLSLMTQQGIGGGAFTKSIYHRGYAICIAAGDIKLARSYLQSEYIAVCNSEGIDSPNALEIECVLNLSE